MGTIVIWTGIQKVLAALKNLHLLPGNFIITTIVLDIAGILLSFLIIRSLLGMMPLYIGASKAYSYRGIRLKKFPVIGYLTVIIFQGALTFWLVYYGSNADNTLCCSLAGNGHLCFTDWWLLSAYTNLSAPAGPGRWSKDYQL